jgi:hypothetical protein
MVRERVKSVGDAQQSSNYPLSERAFMSRAALPGGRPGGIGAVRLRTLSQQQQDDDGHHQERQPHEKPRL